MSETREQVAARELDNKTRALVGDIGAAFGGSHASWRCEKVRALLVRALAACALEAARPFKEALMVNPFSDGQDGDLCLWCRTSYPHGLMTFEEHFLQEHHLATCELMLVLEKWAALERAAGEGKS